MVELTSWACTAYRSGRSGPAYTVDAVHTITSRGTDLARQSLGAWFTVLSLWSGRSGNDALVVSHVQHVLERVVCCGYIVGAWGTGG